MAPLRLPMEELCKNVDMCERNHPQAPPKREGRLSYGVLAPAGMGGIAFLSLAIGSWHHAEVDGLWQSWVGWAGLW